MHVQDKLAVDKCLNLRPDCVHLGAGGKQIEHWHIGGKYDITTDKFIGGGVATFAPDGKIIEAATLEELRAKLNQ